MNNTKDTKTTTGTKYNTNTNNKKTAKATTTNKKNT